MLVVLAPPGADAVLDRLRAWSHARILEPLLWWDAGSDDARLLKNGEVGDESNIAAVLAKERVDPDDVRAVGYIAGGPLSREDVESAIDALAERFARLRKVLAFGKGPEQAALVIVPSTPRSRFHGIEEHMGGFRPVVVVAPEDRRHPFDANFLAHPADEMVEAHVAHALVALGGAQATPIPQVPPIVGLADTSLDHLGGVFVTRSFSRMLDLGYLVDHVASQVLRPGRGWPNPDPLEFDRKELSEEQIDALVEGYFAAHADVLELTSVDPVRPAPPRKLGLWEALRAVAHYLWRSLQKKPVEWLDTKVGGLYDSFAQRLEALAPGSGIEVQRWREEGVTLGEAAHRAHSAIDPHIPDGAVGPTWRDLWRLSIGLVDGAERPQWVPTGVLRSGELKQLAADPDQIVPDPLDLPPSSKGLENVQACDPERWDPLVKSGFAAEPSDSIQELSDDALAALREQLQGYYMPRSTSLLWKIGVRLASNRGLAELERSAPPPEEWPDPGRVEVELASKAKRYRRGFLFNATLLTGVALVGGTVMLSTGHPLWSKVGVWGGEVFLWLVGIALLWRRADRRESADVSETIEEHYELVNRTVVAMYRRVDAVRLGRRYAEYKHWAEIVGHFVHRPFVSVSSSPVEPVPDVDPETLPAAFTVGVGLVDDEELLRAGAEIQRGIFNPSWLRDFADGVMRNVMTDLLTRQGIDAELSGQALPDPFPDVQNEEGSPRRSFLQAVKEGHHRSIDSSPITQHFLQHLGAMASRRFAKTVVDLRDERVQRSFGPTATWVGLPTDGEALASAVRPVVVKVLVSAPDGNTMGSGVVVGPNGLAVTNAHVIDGAATLRVELPGGQQVEARVAARSTTTDLAVVEFTPPSRLPVARIAGSSPAQGAMVVLAGHPFDFDGEPTLTWGLVSASHRKVDLGDGQITVLQTSYPAAGGASGSPVFDLDGKVVAIHVGGLSPDRDEWRGDFVSYAVPVEEVNALLASIGAAPDSSIAPLRYERARRTPATMDDPMEQDVEAFLAALQPAERPALNPTMWTRGTLEQAQVASVLPRDVPNAESPLRTSVGELQFLRPARVWLSRTEVTSPTELTRLVPFAPESGDLHDDDGPQPDADPSQF